MIKSPISKTANEFKVREELKPYLRTVLGRQGIPCWFRNKGGQCYCRVNLSGNKFHDAVMRAICEQKSEETGLLYLTYPESKNVLVRESLMKTFKSNGFAILNSGTCPAQRSQS